MQQSLPSQSPEVHGATSSTVKSLMKKNVIPIDTFVQTFLHTILIGTEHRDIQVADAWIGCLFEIIPLLPFNVLQNDVTPFIITKTLHEKPLSQRVASCRILGALSKRYPPTALKRDLLPVVLSLCQDVHAEVRREMACQLPVVFQPLGSDVVEHLLMPLIVDLASEEITKVKEATFLAIVNSLSLFSAVSLQTTIIPLLKQLFCFALNYDNNLLLAVAENYGRILVEIERVNPASDKECFVKYYLSIVEKASDKQSLLTKADETTLHQVLTRLPADLATVFRKYSATNYAMVVKFAYNENSRVALDGLHRILRGFVSDHCWDVRRQVAASMPEILESYGKYKLLLKDIYIKLISDDMENVLEGIMPKLAQALVKLAKLDAFITDQQEPLTSELLKALKHAEDILFSSLNWRLQCCYVEQMEVIWYIFPTSIIYEMFIDIYLQRIYQTRVFPLRLALIRTILINAKFLQNSTFQNEVKNKICDISTNKSFYNRIIFIRACYIIADIYSTTYFKDNFFMDALKLSDDPVPNIRWALCKFLPVLRSMIRLPKDKHLLKAFKLCVRKLEEDSDREVQMMLKSVLASLDSPDDKAFSNDKEKEVEEKMLASLNPKLVKLFPLSVMHMFNPLVSLSTTSSPSPAENGNGSSKTLLGQIDGDADNNSIISHNVSDKDSGFSDQEFLVDTGVSLNSFEKNNPLTSEICNDEKNVVIKKLSQGKEQTSIYDQKFSKYQNGSKLSPSKKALGRNSIPVRKKTTTPEPQVVKISEPPPVPKAIPESVERNKVSKISAPVVRRSQIAYRPEKRHSLDAVSSPKKIDFESNLAEGVHHLVLIDKEKNLVALKNSMDVNTKIVDVNKNVTSATTTPDESGAVQRRRRSQLPRPLSCVVLPVKSNTPEKTFSGSKLPVMRRS